VLRHRGEDDLHRVRDERGWPAVAFAADAEAVDDGVGAADAAFDILRPRWAAAQNGEPRMAQRHAARFTNQGRHLVALLKRLREYESTGEAGGAEEGELHRVLPVGQPLALGEIEQQLRGAWLLPLSGETSLLIKHIVTECAMKMSAGR
jgi:hypothetical protein